MSFDSLILVKWVLKDVK